MKVNLKANGMALKIDACCQLMAGDSGLGSF